MPSAQLYALYKIATVSLRPSGQRPSLFSFEGRAKYDAWTERGSTLAGTKDEYEQSARTEYEQIARSLGWQSDGQVEATPQSKERVVGMVNVSILANDSLS